MLLSQLRYRACSGEKSGDCGVGRKVNAETDEVVGVVEVAEVVGEVLFVLFELFM